MNPLIEKYLPKGKEDINKAVKNIIATGKKEKNTKAEIVNNIARFLSRIENISMKKATQKALSMV